MIRTDRRIQYSSVALTITALAVVFSTAAFLRRFIGLPEEGRLAGSPAGFLRRAARDRVNWRTLADDPFREAQRLDRTILIVAGAERSEAARQFDRRILSIADVVERLNREFLPVRIDLDQDPQWIGAFLPLSVAEGNADEGFYAACLAPSGRLLAFLTRSSPAERIDEAELLNFLREARRKRALPIGTEVPVERDQALQTAIVTPGRPAEQSERDYAELLAKRIDAVSGGFRTPRSRRVWPWEWKYLALSRDYRALAVGLDPVTRGPLMDWTGPGAYRLSTDPFGRSPGFARDAVADAECASLFAVWAVNGGGDWPKALAQEFVRGIRASYLVGPRLYGSIWRSPYTSNTGLNLLVSRRALAEKFTRAERDWLRENLLVPDPANPASVPIVRQPTGLLFGREKTLEMARRIGEASHLPIERGGEGYLDVLATVGARMLEVGRLLDDDEARSFGLELFAQASRFRAGPYDVSRSLAAGGAVRRTAFEYAAYTEIALEAYFASGEPRFLDEADKVFNRALELYFEPETGRVRSIVDAGTPSAFGTDAPFLADGDRPSLVSTMARCSWLLSCAWRGTARGDAYLATARTIVRAYSPAVSRLEFRVGSFEAAKLLIARDEFVWVAGKGSVGKARSVSPSLEGVLVVPDGRTGPSPLPGPGVWRFSGGSAPERIEALSALP